MMHKLRLGWKMCLKSRDGERGKDGLVERRTLAIILFKDGELPRL